MTTVLDRGVVLAPVDETKEIKILDTLLQGSQLTEAVLVGPGNQSTRVPASVLQLLSRIVHELASGNAVTVLPIHAELTTQQAANLLSVSRPSLIRLLEAGQIPYSYAGTHRRVRVTDLMAYQTRRAQLQKAALDEMLRDAEEQGLYELLPGHPATQHRGADS
jgi:excisionase family DNA binding protein